MIYNATTEPVNAAAQRTWRLYLCVFVILASVYFITYSGRIESGDTARYLDAVSSLTDHGDLLLDGSADQFPPQRFDPANPLPLEQVEVEPLQVVLAAPLDWLAQTFSLGRVHTVYLFNVIVMALAGMGLSAYALMLGYAPRTAFVMALLFGVTTAVFAYSKTFFREPLTLLMLLACAYALERWRTSGYRAVVWGIAALLALIAVVLSKASAVMALPALVVIVLPALSLRRLPRGVVLGVAAAGVLVVGLVLLLSTGVVEGIAGRYDLLDRLRAFTPGEFFGTALAAYLVSPGGSVWGTSPLILLAVPGAVLALRAGRWRYPLAAALMIGAFAVGYALFSDSNWFGGLSFPPRFLIPVIPFGVLAALPAIDRAVTRPRSLWMVGLAALSFYGLWIQITAVSVDWRDYVALLPLEAGGLGEWIGGLYDPRYFRWVLIPQVWGHSAADIGWVVIGALFIPVIAAGIALFTLVVRRALIGLVALIVLTGVGLRLLYVGDFRYQVEDQALWHLLNELEDRTQPDDVILLSSPRYTPFFANYGDLNDAGRVIALPLQPGERSSPEMPPRVESDYPPALLEKDTIQLIANLAQTHDRLWLVVDGNPELWWSVRPVERYLTALYYPLDAPLQVGDFTRLVAFDTTRAPEPLSLQRASVRTDLRFGESIHLAGVELPNGTIYAAGDQLPVSLEWLTDAPLTARYSIGLYLRAADGSPIAQIDAPPAAGFAPTDSWRVRAPVWDNRAFTLPDDLRVGAYQLWVKVYDFGADGGVRDLPVTAGDSIDGVIGVLPVMITVE